MTSLLATLLPATPPQPERVRLVKLISVGAQPPTMRLDVRAAAIKREQRRKAAR